MTRPRPTGCGVPSCTKSSPWPTSSPACGRSVGSPGDVDGDGYVDLLVGATDSYVYAPGAAYLFRGGPSLDGVIDFTLAGTLAGGRFGDAIAIAAR